MTEKDIDHIGKLPGDDGWFKLAALPSILPWSIAFALLVVFAVPTFVYLPAVDIPTRVRLGLGGMYIAAFFGIAAACDRAVQLERIRRRSI